jgi:hypothetical protein
MHKLLKAAIVVGILAFQASGALYEVTVTRIDDNLYNLYSGVII